MAEFAALPLFTDSWIADTSHLTYAERGLYLDLLVLMWRSPECRVPNDMDWIARKLGCLGNAIAYATLQCHVSEFCQTDGNWLVQKRLKKEFEYIRKNTQRMSDMANRRWNKYKNISQGNAAQHGYSNAPVGNAPSPSPTYKREKNVLRKEGEKNNGRVYVKAGTPAGDAWDAFLKAQGKSPRRDFKGGWWFPSEFPETEQRAKT
jgi:uncharacterized protein YdaU (DUF1376 family)